MREKEVLAMIGVERLLCCAIQMVYTCVLNHLMKWIEFKQKLIVKR